MTNTDYVSGVDFNSVMMFACWCLFLPLLLISLASFCKTLISIFKSFDNSDRLNKPKAQTVNRVSHRDMVSLAKGSKYRSAEPIIKPLKQVSTRKFRAKQKHSLPKKPCIKPVVAFESEPHFILNDTSKPKPKPELPEFISQVSYGLHGLGVSRTEAKKIASSTYCQKRHKNATDLLNDCLKKL